MKAGQPVKLHGVDVRIMDEEQAWHLNRLRMKQNIHIAWDLPQLDLRDRLKEMVKHVKPYKITCYVLIGFNSTIEQDLFRLNVLRELGITPFVIPFRLSLIHISEPTRQAEISYAVFCLKKKKQKKKIKEK